ncbi:MAG: beta-ribofuranosylaminobenzene 5'-phosphate synthase family protein [Methylophilaceae bacterium]
MQSTQSVTIQTTARLHMGFIDLHGGLGRRYGSIGLSLDNPATVISVRQQPKFSAEGLLAERVLDYAHQFVAGTGIKGGAHFDVQHIIPEHAGLGSGTQLALAVGASLMRLYGLSLTTREIAAKVGRGMRSGVGVGVFEHGGLVVDGGHGANTIVPPVLARLDFPEDWRILLVLDDTSKGVHGEAEMQAFAQLPEFPALHAAHIARMLLMQALPAVIEQDLAAFGEAVCEMQQLVGEHFAPAQGGGHYTSEGVASAMQWLETQGVACLGQSSWGPTGFAVVASQQQAEALSAELQQHQSALKFLICRANNRGAITLG